jgi:hypothetical protein
VRDFKRESVHGILNAVWPTLRPFQGPDALAFLCAIVPVYYKFMEQAMSSERHSAEFFREETVDFVTKLANGPVRDYLLQLNENQDADWSELKAAEFRNELPIKDVAAADVPTREFCEAGTGALAPLVVHNPHCSRKDVLYYMYSMLKVCVDVHKENVNLSKLVEVVYIFYVFTCRNPSSRNRSARTCCKPIQTEHTPCPRTHGR